MALSPKAEELLFHIPIHWDPIPDWWLDRIDDQRILIDLLAVRLETQREIFNVQAAAIDKSLAVLKGMRG